MIGARAFPFAAQHEGRDAAPCVPRLRAGDFFAFGLIASLDLRQGWYQKVLSRNVLSCFIAILYALGKIKGQDAYVLTWCFMEPMSGFEPLTYALRVRYAFASNLGKLQEKGTKWY